MPERPSQDPWFQSANDRWKRRWDLRLACSMVAAALLHGGVVAFWPAGVMDGPRAEATADPLQLLQLSRTSPLPARPGPGPVPIPAAPVAEAASDSAGGEDEDDGPSAESRPEVASVSESFLERIRDGIPRPRVLERQPTPEVEDEPESAADDAGAEDDEIAAESGPPSTADVPDVLELSDLELERLSAIRPELTLTAPSGWVLVRNRDEVRRFMRRIYRRGLVDPAASGSVSVALWIDEEGSVEWAEITDSSGREDMDRAALDLFEDVVAFWPAREEGVPVATSAIFSVVFPWPSQ